MSIFSVLEQLTDVFRSGFTRSFCHSVSSYRWTKIQTMTTFWAKNFPSSCEPASTVDCECTWCDLLSIPRLMSMTVPYCRFVFEPLATVPTFRMAAQKHNEVSGGTQSILRRILMACGSFATEWHYVNWRLFFVLTGWTESKFSILRWHRGACSLLTRLIMTRQIHDLHACIERQTIDSDLDIDVGLWTGWLRRQTWMTTWKKWLEWMWSRLSTIIL